MAAAASPLVHAQPAVDSSTPLTDLSIDSEYYELRGIGFSWFISVKNNPVGSHARTTAHTVKVKIVTDNGVDGPFTEVRTIRGLLPGRSVELLVAPQTITGACGSSPVLVWLQAEIIETDPLEPPGLQFNNTTEHVGLNCPERELAYTDGDTAVDVGISDRSPQAGGATTFTVRIVNPRGAMHDFGHATTPNDHTQIDVQVKIELSPGLTFDETQSAPSGTTFDPATGTWDVGTLEARSVKSLQVAVNLASESLADLPLEERCLTAEVVRAVPWFAWDGSKRENDTATVCLGGPNVLLRQGPTHLFYYYDCVGVTAYPCTSADTLELVAGPAPGRTNIDLQPNEPIVHVSDPEGRHGGNWKTGTTQYHATNAPQVDGLEVTIRFFPSGWSQYTLEISDVSPKQRPGAFSILGGAPGTTAVLDADTKPSLGPVDLPTSLTSNPYPTLLAFGTLGTYEISLTVGATKSMTAYTDTGTYTFHVGPVADLEVRDAGASPAVAAGRRAYTVMAVNNGPDAAPAVRVTGLPTGVTEFTASQGDYNPASGVWTVGKLSVRDAYRASGHADEGPTLTIITADAAGAEITAAIKNTQIYQVCIDSSGDNVELSSPSSTACTTEDSSNTWHTAEYYDHIQRNNTATITARAGTGEGVPGTPRSLEAMTTPLGNVLTWQPVERVNGLAVTHYQVQRSASPWEALTGDSPLPSHPKDAMYLDTTGSGSAAYRVRAVNIFGIPGAWSEPSAQGPAAPGDFTVTALGDTSIRISWSKPAGPEPAHYELEYSGDGVSNWISLAEVTGGAATSYTYTDSGLTPNTTRHYRVRGVSMAGGAEFPGEWSAVGSATTTTDGPEAPALTAAVNAQNGIALTWNEPNDNGAGITGYRVERSDDSAGPWQALAASHQVTSYTDTGLQGGSTRHYRVAAVSGLGTGAWSNVAEVTTLGPPGDFTPMAQSGTEIELSWSKPVGPGPARYELEYSSDGGANWSSLAQVTGGAATSYTYADSGLTPNTTRHYRVRGVATVAGGAELHGPWSAVRDATTSTQGPESPVLTATASGQNVIRLGWTVPTAHGTNITGYRVERSRDGTGRWETLAENHPGTSWADTGLRAGSKRYYRVAAVSQELGRGPWSDVVSETTDGAFEARTPDSPESLRITSVAGDKVTLAWDPPLYDGGKAVTGYEYAVSYPDGRDKTGNTARTTASISGLNAAGTYRFRVRAVNAAGPGDWTPYVQQNLNPTKRGQVIVSPSSLTVDEGGSASYRVKLTNNPTQPIALALVWEGDDDLTGELPWQQYKVLLPGNYPEPPEGSIYYEFAYPWNKGVEITVWAAEDEDTDAGTAVISHDVYNADQSVVDELVEHIQYTDPDWKPNWRPDPRYDHITGPSVKVTERDNDGVATSSLPSGAPGPEFALWVAYAGPVLLWHIL